MSGFWQGRRVLVTGHTGFKGAWLTKWLDMLGAVTLGLSLPPDEYSLYDKISFSGGHKTAVLDVRDRAALALKLKEFEPEIVFHLAAQAIVGEARKDPAGTFETNLMGTVGLLEAVREAGGVKAALIVTSDKVYENTETMEPYAEGSRLGGDEPYAASKACAELAVMAYRNAGLTGGAGIATARAANVYGGGDLRYDRLIPYMIRRKIENLPAEIRNPEAVRPWQHVLSPLKGYLLLARALHDDPEGFSEGFNFGPPDEEIYTVGRIAAMIAGKAGIGPEGKGSAFREAGILRIDSAKSRERLGWIPVIDIEAGLRETEGFYRALYAGKDAAGLMERAVEYYGGSV